jgi:hypothetical protein
MTLTRIFADGYQPSSNICDPEYRGWGALTSQ